MYSFKQFLAEEYADVSIEDVVRECAPFLKAAKGKFIYRGMKKPTGAITITAPEGNLPAYRMDIRQDRKPRHSGSKTHDVVDQYMEREFGFAGRSQGLFVGGEGHGVRMYGPTYIILPRGEFKFLWSPKMFDLITFAAEEFDDVEREIRDMHYQTTDLPAAIDSENEIMIGAKDYYAIPNSAEARELITRYSKMK